jgi:hypothetical protein
LGRKNEGFLAEEEEGFLGERGFPRKIKVVRVEYLRMPLV